MLTCIAGVLGLGVIAGVYQYRSKLHRTQVDNCVGVDNIPNSERIIISIRHTHS